MLFRRSLHRRRLDVAFELGRAPPPAPLDKFVDGDLNRLAIAACLREPAKCVSSAWSAPPVCPVIPHFKTPGLVTFVSWARYSRTLGDQRMRVPHAMSCARPRTPRPAPSGLLSCTRLRMLSSSLSADGAIRTVMCRPFAISSGQSNPIGIDPAEYNPRVAFPSGYRCLSPRLQAMALELTAMRTRSRHERS